MPGPLPPMTARAFTIILLIVGAAPALAGPCTPVEHQTTVCDDGKQILRVIRESVSPSKRYAIAWSVTGDNAMNDLEEDQPSADTPDDSSRSTENRDHVLNYLVRLSDGKALKVVDSRHFGDRQRYNHFTHDVFWSPDERTVVQVTDWRFGSSVASAYRIGADDVLTDPLRLTPPTRRAAAALLKTPKERRDIAKADATFSIETVENDGTIKLAVGFAAPKDQGVDFDIVMRIKPSGNTLTAEIKTIQRHKD